jgi:uncharacterized Tic20 family protein
MNPPDPYDDYRWTEEPLAGSRSSEAQAAQPILEPLSPLQGPLETRAAEPKKAPTPGGGTRPERQEATSGPRFKPCKTSDWPLMAHLSTFAGLAVPFGNVLGPLIIWLSMREDDAEAEWHAREALNFQISLWIWGFIGVLLALSVIGLPVAIVGFIFGGTFSLIVTLIAAVKAHQGERWEYPLCFRLVGPPDRGSAPNAEHLGATA